MSPIKSRLVDLFYSWVYAELALRAWWSSPADDRADAHAAYRAALEREECAATVLAAPARASGAGGFARITRCSSRSTSLPWSHGAGPPPDAAVPLLVLVAVRAERERGLMASALCSARVWSGALADRSTYAA
jgi:hypothetical protein